MSTRSSWHDAVVFGIHYDLHANANDTELGAELTPEHLRERLERVKPDWIQCDCKGHPGYTSWPTQVGSPSPGVCRDALAIHREVTRDLGIKLGMHYSGVIDQRAIELHPEWARVSPEGERDDRRTCLLSDYSAELMIPQMLELIERYDVDGFWVDGDNWGARPCWCDRCKGEYVRRTGATQPPMSADDDGWADWVAFHRSLFIEYVTRYAEAVHAAKPDCAVCSNWMYTIRQPEPVAAPVDYLSGDFTPAWGADRAALEGRLLDGRDMSWDLMAWGFVNVGGHGGGAMPWQMKTAVHLCQEVAEVVALGGAVMVYNTPQRSGWLTGWHQDTLGEVAAFVRERADLCFGSRSASEVAILHLADHYYAHNDPLFNYGRAVDPVEGALHALLETGRSTDILTEQKALERIDRYRLLVVPEQTTLSDTVRDALESFALEGGHVLLSGNHLSHETPDLVGARPAGAPADAGRSWLRAGDEAASISPGWQPVTPADGSDTVAVRLKQQEPEKDATNDVLVTRRRVGQGTITAVHGPIFRDYAAAHYPQLRRVVAELVDALDIAWSAEADGPPWLELVAREKDGQTVVSLLNRGAGETMSARRVIIEHLPPVENVTLRIRRDAAPASVTIVPETAGAEWTFEDGVLTVTLPEVAVQTVVGVG